MKKLSVVLTVCAVLVSCLSASALTYTDIQYPNKYVASGGSTSGTFNIVDPAADGGLASYTIGGFSSGNGSFTDRGGYVPGTPISDVAVRFYLTDRDSRPLDVFLVSLDGIISGGGLMMSQKAIFSFKGGSGVIEMLELDGKLNYTVSSVIGDFTVQYALLVANTPTSTSPNVTVPDGGLTAVLLGFGLLGILAVQRRFAPAK